MKHTTSGFQALVFVALVISMLAIPAIAADDDKERHDPIVGSWHVTVSFSDGRAPVDALYTFNSDQTFTMGGSWPGQFGPGHGAWNQSQLSDRAAIDLTFFRLLYTPSEANEATGALGAAFNGTLKVQARLTVSDDGQTFSGNYLLTNFDASGNVRSTLTGDLYGSLIVIEPLP